MPDRGTVWTYLTTDQPFGNSMEAALSRGIPYLDRGVMGWAGDQARASAPRGREFDVFVDIREREPAADRFQLDGFVRARSALRE